MIQVKKSVISKGNSGKYFHRIFKVMNIEIAKVAVQLNSSLSDSDSQGSSLLWWNKAELQEKYLNSSTWLSLSLLMSFLVKEYEKL